MAAAGGAYPHASFMKFPRLNPAHPILLKAGTGEPTILYFGDDFSRDPSPAFVVALRLRFKEQVSPSALSVTLNGRELRGSDEVYALFAGTVGGRGRRYLGWGSCGPNAHRPLGGVDGGPGDAREPIVELPLPRAGAEEPGSGYNSWRRVGLRSLRSEVWCTGVAGRRWS